MHVVQLNVFCVLEIKEHYHVLCLVGWRVLIGMSPVFTTCGRSCHWTAQTLNVCRVGSLMIQKFLTWSIYPPAFLISDMRDPSLFAFSGNSVLFNANSDILELSEK